MKKLFAFLIALIIALTFSSCQGTKDDTRYDKIARYVAQNLDLLDPVEDVEFYDFEDDGVFYGYYYSANNDILLPELYRDANRDALQADLREGEGEFYFGDPNGEGDWCLIKPILDNWYYYELYWD